MNRSNIGKVLQHAEIPPHVYQSAADRKEMKEAVQSALFELSFGLQGCAYNAYSMGCSIEGGDADWKEAGTLEEMQTLVALSDLLNFLVNENAKLKDA